MGDHPPRKINTNIISSTLILAADWSISMVYWTVLHCLSLIVNVRVRINCFIPITPCFIPLCHGYYGFGLKFTGHKFVCFYITKTQNLNKKHKIKKIKIIIIDKKRIIKKKKEKKEKSLKKNELKKK